MKREVANQQNLKVHVEFGGSKADFEGNPDMVAKAFLSFLSNTYPAFELAQKLSFSQDIVKLAEALVSIIEYAPEGLLLTAQDIPAEEAILISLLGIHVGNKLGKVVSESISAINLSKITGKALKTISNQLAWMVDDSLVERIGRGEYKITSMGIKRSEKILQELKTGVKQA